MKKILFFTLLSLLFISPMAAQQPKELAVGDYAPNFTLPDTKGNMVSLKSLQGKWVVLDFWGSWCRWCIKGFPEMKKSYSELKDKVTFVGVACRDQKDTWLNAVKEYQLPWLNVWVNPEDQSVMQTYQLRGFPTKIILDPQGKIANISLGEDPEFYTILHDLVK